MAQILIFSFFSPTSTERYSALVLTWHHELNGHEFEQTPGDGEGKGSLACCSHRVTKSQTELSSWTIATLMLFFLPDDITVMHAKSLHSALCDTIEPARLLCPWDSPGNNTGVGCRALLRALPAPGIEPASPGTPASQADSLLLSHLGSPSSWPIWF